MDEALKLRFRLQSIKKLMDRMAVLSRVERSEFIHRCEIRYPVAESGVGVDVLIPVDTFDDLPVLQDWGRWDTLEDDIPEQYPPEPLLNALPVVVGVVEEERINAHPDVCLIRLEGERDLVLSELDYLSSFVTSFKVSGELPGDDHQMRIYVKVVNDAERDSQYSDLKLETRQSQLHLFRINDDTELAFLERKFSRHALHFLDILANEDPLQEVIDNADCIVVEGKRWTTINLMDQAMLYDASAIRVESEYSDAEFPSAEYRRKSTLHGRRLELISDRPFIEASSVEKLDRQIALLLDKRDLAASSEAATERLYRFDESQLEGLVVALRDVSLEDLQSKKITWCHVPGETDGTGYYYLLFDRDSQAATNSPMYSPSEAYGLPPSRAYRVDPLWLRHYSGGKARLMVPEGQLLYPRLHSLDPNGMDAYLARLVGDWGVASEVDLESFYVFEEMSNDKMRIRVIARKEFRTIPDDIGFLNLNLSFTRYTLDQFSKETTEKGEVAWYLRETDEVKRFYEASRKKSTLDYKNIKKQEFEDYSAFISDLDQMLGDFDHQSEAVQNTLEKRIKDLEKLNEKLNELTEKLRTSGAKITILELKTTAEKLSSVIAEIDEYEIEAKRLKRLFEPGGP